MRAQLAPLWKWDIILKLADRARGPILILLWLIQSVCFFLLVCCEGEGERRVLCLPSICSGNKWICVFFFIASAPQMGRSFIESQESTYVSLRDREITQRWQKASATSITCLVPPAISRSSKGSGDGDFSPPQWSEANWRRVFTPAGVQVNRLTILELFLLLCFLNHMWACVWVMNMHAL